MTVYFYLRITRKKLKVVFLWSIPCTAPQTHTAGSGSMFHSSPHHSCQLLAQQETSAPEEAQWRTPWSTTTSFLFTTLLTCFSYMLVAPGGIPWGSPALQLSPAAQQVQVEMHLQKWGNQVNKFPTFLKSSFQFDNFFNTLNLAGNFQHSWVPSECS